MVAVIICNMQKKSVKLSVYLYNSGSEGGDLHPVLCAQLSGDDTKNTSAEGFLFVVEQDTGVVVESNIASVRSWRLLASTHHKGMAHITLLHLLRRSLTRQVRVNRPCSLHNAHNLVACQTLATSVSPVLCTFSRIVRKRTSSGKAATVHDANALGDNSARVVNDIEGTLQADHYELVSERAGHRKTNAEICPAPSFKISHTQ